ALTLQQSGDYFVALTLPVERTDTRSEATEIEADVRLDGTKQASSSVSRSAYSDLNSATTSSDHLYAFLHNVTAGQKLNIDTHGLGVLRTRDTVRVTTLASLYVEYVDNTRTIYNAVATTTNNGTNLNSAATSSLLWWDLNHRSDSGYTHSNASNAQNITLAAAGDYLVYYNIPVNDDTISITSGRVRSRPLLNGTIING